MSGTVYNICPISEEDYKELRRLINQKLTDVKIVDGDFFNGTLVLEFERSIVRISMQESDTHGTNVFFFVEEVV